MKTYSSKSGKYRVEQSDTNFLSVIRNSDIHTIFCYQQETTFPPINTFVTIKECEWWIGGGGLYATHL